MPCIPLIPPIPPAMFAVAPLLPLGFPLTLLPASRAGWTEAPVMAILAADIDEALLGCRSSALLWMLMGALPNVGMPLPVPLARSCASAPIIVLAVTSVFLWRASASVRTRLTADPWNLGKSPILRPSVAVGMLRGGSIELSWLLHLPPKGETGAKSQSATPLGQDVSHSVFARGAGRRVEAEVHSGGRPGADYEERRQMERCRQ
jgi:hypothetical protein